MSLDTAIEEVRRARLLRRLVAGAAIGSGFAALASLAGAPVGLVVVVGLLPLIAAGLIPRGHRAIAERLDEVARLDGALVCAWDHRGEGGAMVEAQRRRALAALAAARRTMPRPVPRPHPLWALGPALWLLMPLAEAPTVSLGRVGGDSISPSAAVDPVTGAKADQSTPASPDRRAARAATRPEAAPPEPEAAPSEPEAEPEDGAGPDEAAPRPDPANQIAGAGVGARAADQVGPRAGRRDAPLAPGEGPALTLAGAPGDQAGRLGDGRAVVGRSPPPPDAIADPARPYPARYHRAIAAWFDRGSASRTDR